MTPSIWTASYRSKAEWDGALVMRTEIDSILGDIDDSLLHPLRHTVLRAWCAACQSVQHMGLTWHFGGVDENGVARVGWTETALCGGCGLNSRMRAVVDFVRRTGVRGDCLLAEQLTPSTPVFRTMFDSVICSEYLGPDLQPGSIHVRGKNSVRHEDLTALSLDDSSVDLIVTQDVFEHIPDFDGAFAECRRVIRPGGRLVFSIPFFPDQGATEIIASIGTDGSISHVGAPEIHGNPLGGGSLCFQHFGWDILDRLRSAGFSDAAAHAYRGAWQGHLLGPSFVFEASR